MKDRSVTFTASVGQELGQSTTPPCLCPPVPRVSAGRFNQLGPEQLSLFSRLCLHMVSLVTSSTWSSRVTGFLTCQPGCSQDTSPERERASQGKFSSLDDPASEVMLQPFCGILLTEQLQSLSSFKGREHGPHLSMEGGQCHITRRMWEWDMYWHSHLWKMENTIHPITVFLKEAVLALSALMAVKSFGKSAAHVFVHSANTEQDICPRHHRMPSSSPRSWEMGHMALIQGGIGWRQVLERRHKY